MVGCPGASISADSRAPQGDTSSWLTEQEGGGLVLGDGGLNHRGFPFFMPLSSQLSCVPVPLCSSRGSTGARNCEGRHLPLRLEMLWSQEGENPIGFSLSLPLAWSWLWAKEEGSRPRGIEPLLSGWRTKGRRPQALVSTREIAKREELRKTTP